jgi:hypothetical protein
MYWLAIVLFFIGILVYGYSISNKLKVVGGGCNSCPKNNGNMSM